MKVKTSELIGAALDWAVGDIEKMHRFGSFDDVDNFWRDEDNRWFMPSTDWAQGGPIIEREEIYLNPNNGNDLWFAETTIDGPRGEFGPTPLIAAMRCYVANKLGDEIEIPDNLKQ